MVKVCTTSPLQFPYFTIGGAVTSSVTAGSLPIAGATVKIYKFGTTTIVRTLTTVAGGAYSATGLPPGQYTLVTTATGYTFTSVNKTVGPTDLAFNILAN